LSYVEVGFATLGDEKEPNSVLVLLLPSSYIMHVGSFAHGLPSHSNSLPQGNIQITFVMDSSSFTYCQCYQDACPPASIYTDPDFVTYICPYPAVGKRRRRRSSRRGRRRR